MQRSCSSCLARYTTSLASANRKYSVVPKPPPKQKPTAETNPQRRTSGRRDDGSNERPREYGLRSGESNSTSRRSTNGNEQGSRSGSEAARRSRLAGYLGEGNVQSTSDCSKFPPIRTAYPSAREHTPEYQDTGRGVRAPSHPRSHDLTVSVRTRQTIRKPLYPSPPPPIDDTATSSVCKVSPFPFSRFDRQLIVSTTSKPSTMIQQFKHFTALQPHRIQ
jgi:hypothetical protein